MPAELVADDENLATQSETPPTLDELEGVWMRPCPVCQVVLCKSTLSEPAHCPCGWEWQA
jgi:hypothetical protein